jgi:ribonuclease HI
MAVKQENKGKVRPVLDYRELNWFVESFTGDSDVCSESLRRWRQMPGEPAVLDLRNAYLQLWVRPDLRKYQVVVFKGVYYELTRLGFGLNCAPKIMSAVLRKVLSLDPVIFAATSHYIDDIIVDTSVVSLQAVSAHLEKYGLITKPPERIEESRVLGLQMSRGPDGRLVWHRGNSVPEVLVSENLTRRELFSLCGKLVGHYPVAGWQRTACSYIKRHSAGSGWDGKIGGHAARMLKDTLSKVAEVDPVKGEWAVASGGIGKVWCDASSTATGVVLEIGGVVVEDCSWLRKANDGAHINVSELEAVVKGVNLALKWRLKTVTLLTDSMTVFSWVSAALSGSSRIKVTGLSEMLVRRRIGTLVELRDEYSLKLSVEFVVSREQGRCVNACSAGLAERSQHAQ